MKTKNEIVENWLVRYTKRKLEDFTPYILLTNFNNYVELFAQQFGVEVAICQRQWHHYNQFWHGVAQRSTHHGPPQRNTPKGSPISWQMRRFEK